MSNNQHNGPEDEDEVFRRIIEESKTEAERANALSEQEQLRQAMQLSMQERDRIDARYQQDSDAAVQRLLRESAIEAEARQQREFDDNLRKIMELSIQDREAHQAELDRQANEHFRRAIQESYSDWNADQDRLEREVRVRSARADATYQTIGVVGEDMFTDKEEEIWNPPAEMLSERQRQQMIGKGKGKASNTAPVSTPRSRPPSSTTATYSPSAVSSVSTGGLSTRATSSVSTARPGPTEATSSGKYGPSTVSGVSTRDLPTRASSSASTARPRPPQPTSRAIPAPSTAPGARRTFVPLEQAMEEIRRQNLAREAEERVAALRSPPSSAASPSQQRMPVRPEARRQPTLPPIEYEDISGEVAARLAEKAGRRAAQTSLVQQTPSRAPAVVSQPEGQNVPHSVTGMPTIRQAPSESQPKPIHEATPEAAEEEAPEAQNPDDIRARWLASMERANLASRPNIPTPSNPSSTTTSATTHPPPPQRPPRNTRKEERRERMRRNAQLGILPAASSTSASGLPSRYVPPPEPPAPPSAPVPAPPPSDATFHTALTTARPETVVPSEANCSVAPDDSVSHVVRRRVREREREWEQDDDGDERPRTAVELREARLRAMGVGAAGNVRACPSVIAEENEEAEGEGATWSFGDIRIRDV